MGNENQVKEIVQRSKEIFLPDELRPDEPPHVYSLNEEFAKSKQYRSFLFGIKVILFLVGMVGLTYVLSIAIEKFRGETHVEITEFDDLKLRDLLDSTSKYQNELNSVREELASLRSRMQEEILTAKNEASRERESVLAMNLSSEETKARIDKIKEKEEARIRAIRAEYQRKIDERDKKIAELNQKIAEINKDMKTNIKKAEDIIGNFEKLYTIKMNRQREAYEKEIRELKEYYKRYIDALILKYNPIFKSGKVVDIIATARGDISSIPFNPYYDIFSKEKIISKSEFDRIRQNSENYSTLMDRMLQIPYENSIPPTLSSMNFLFRKTSQEYEKLIKSLVEAIKRKNQIIQNYRYAIDQYSVLYPENGFVIDPRDSKYVRVHLSKIHSVKTGDYGYVFRDDDEYIGKLVFIVSDIDVYARVIETVENKSLKPFDRILIKYQKEQP
ncbi:MAG: hypothetical protein N2316_11560 [Spirochaetes bacterium]|nr:hypothetical protein [Spirochaetota bacterium]